jgi:hypothetical protein
MTDGYCTASALQGNIKLLFPFIPNNSTLCYIIERQIKQGSYRKIEGSIKKEDGVVCRNFNVGSGTEELCHLQTGNMSK